MTGHLRTIHSSKSVIAAWEETKQLGKPTDFKVVPKSAKVARHGPSSSWVDIRFTFAVHGDLQGNAAGFVSVTPDQQNHGQWKIWMLRTWLENFQGHGHPDELQPGPARTDSHVDDRTINHHQAGKGSEEHDVVIVGGGQAGLCVAGRLRALGVPYVLFERNAEIGQSWTNRYESLRWHTSKEYGHLPFDRTYLPSDDYLLTTKMIGSGFRRYTERYDINVRCGVTVEGASFDETNSSWTITTKSKDTESKIVARTLVLATGGYAGVPVNPDWPGRERYNGTALHGTEFKSAAPWKGKRGVVVGTANTGHDVAEDMVQAGFESVTMVQRGKTFVFPAEWLHKAEDVFYHKDLPTSEADRTAFTYPNKIMREFTNRKVHELIDGSPERFDALERAGFKLERKGDIYNNLYSRFGGHYIDIGTSDRIAKGQIKMKSDSAVKEWTDRGLLFEDGSELEADLVVLCTGFDHDFRKMSASIIGEKAADSMEDFFGIDAEGEVRGAYKLAGRKSSTAMDVGIECHSDMY